MDNFGALTQQAVQIFDQHQLADGPYRLASGTYSHNPAHYAGMRDNRIERLKKRIQRNLEKYNRVRWGLRRRWLGKRINRLLRRLKRLLAKQASSGGGLDTDQILADIGAGLAPGGASMDSEGFPMVAEPAGDNTMLWLAGGGVAVALLVAVAMTKGKKGNKKKGKK